MDLKLLKKEYGKDISFRGGSFDVQKLPFMTQDEIRAGVKEAIQIMAPGGGYAFEGSHNILPETPGESAYNVYVAARETGII